LRSWGTSNGGNRVERIAWHGKGRRACSYL